MTNAINLAEEVLRVRRSRVKVLPVNPVIFLSLCKQPAEKQWYVTSDGQLPEDAELVGAVFDSIQDVWILGIRSDEFDPVPAGQAPPVLPPVVVTLTARDATFNE